MSRIVEDMQLASELEASATKQGQKLFDRLGGRATLEHVHKLFYDRIYAHPWIGQFFHGINQNQIESQQTDFMTTLFGGPKNYGGRMPIDAHEHIRITNDLFDLRQRLLKEALDSANIPESLQIDWLRIDGAFRRVLIKPLVSDCKKRYATDRILDFPNPADTGIAS